MSRGRGFSAVMDGESSFGGRGGGRGNFGGGRGNFGGAEGEDSGASFGGRGGGRGNFGGGRGNFGGAEGEDCGASFGGRGGGRGNFGGGRGNFGGAEGEDAGASFGGRGGGRGNFGGGRGNFGGAEGEDCGASFGGRGGGRGNFGGGRGNFGGAEGEDSGASFGGRGGGRGNFGGGRGNFGGAEGEDSGASFGGRGGGRGNFGGGRGNFGGAEGEDSGASFGGRGGGRGNFGGGRGNFGGTEGEDAGASFGGRGGGRGNFGGGRGNFGGAEGEDSGASFGGRGGGRGNFGGGCGNSNGGEGEDSGASFGGRGGGHFGGNRGGNDGESGHGGGGRANFGGPGGENGEGAPPGFDEDRPAPATYIPAIKEIDELFAIDEQSAVYADVADADEDVIVKGIDESKIVVWKNWSDCPFPEQLRTNLVNRCKYAKPRKIQASVMPLVSQGYDVMGHAETGGGKTAAFMVPIIQKIMETPPEDPMTRCCPVAIVIGPTRELVLQLSEQGRKFAHETGVTVAKAYGQYNVRENLREIRCGCDILCATPGRLKHFVMNREIRFTNLKYLVLDEADHLMETNFWEEILELLRMEGFPQTENRQTLLFSATFSDQVQSLADDILRTSHRVMVSNKQTSGHACSKVKQTFVSVPKFEKNNKVYEILEKELQDQKESLTKAGENTEGAHVRRTLVFTQLKRTTDLLAGFLSTKGIKATSINGDRTQELRERALRDFREDRCHVLVATDVCARGIDIHDLEHVINYDLPQDVTTYIHRIGRTGRLCEGTATSFVDPAGDSTDLCHDIVDVVRGAQQEAPQFLVDVGEGRRPDEFGGDGGADNVEADNSGW